MNLSFASGIAVIAAAATIGTLIGWIVGHFFTRTPPPYDDIVPDDEANIRRLTPRSARSTPDTVRH